MDKMANNVKQPPIVIMSQSINTTSVAPQRSITTSASTESQSIIATSSTQNNVSTGDLQCCGKWFSSSKSFHRHLIDAAQSDPKHETKLFRLGMRRCSLCPMWIHKNAMTQHIKRNHSAMISSDNTSPNTVVTSIQRQQQQQHHVVGNRITIPNVNKNDQHPVSLGSGGSPGYIIRVSGQPQQFVRVGKPVQQINKVVGSAVTSPNVSQKVQFKTTSGMMLPNTLASTVITDKNGATLGYKVGGKQIFTKNTMSADGVRRFTFGTLGSGRKILPGAKGAELQKKVESELSNPENINKIVYGNTKSDGENLGSLTYNEKNSPKVTYKGKNLGSQIVRKNVTGTNISYKVLQQPPETVVNDSQVETYIETSNKKLSKKKRKQVLSPSVESVDTVTIDNDSSVDMYTKGKKVNRPSKKQKSTPTCLDDSMEQYDNVTPKNQRKNAKGSKGSGKNNSDSIYTPIGTSSGRGRGKGRKKGPGRPRRIVMENPEPSESDSILDTREDYENTENEPELDNKKCKVEEPAIEVELDLFTLPSVNEKQVSVFLVEPKNPDFKVYANMDAIFVGDSALGDVTNQIGYITDMNNVVFVNPAHFLFPNVKDIDNFVPKQLLIMKCKTSNFQTKPQASLKENFKSFNSKSNELNNKPTVNNETSPIPTESNQSNISLERMRKYIESTNNTKTEENIDSRRIENESKNVDESLNKDIYKVKDKEYVKEMQTDVINNLLESKRNNKPKIVSDQSIKSDKEILDSPRPSLMKGHVKEIQTEVSNNLLESKRNSNEEIVSNESIKSDKEILDSTRPSFIKGHVKEIQTEVSNNLLESKRKINVEIVSNQSIKNYKEILASPKPSLIKLPDSGLRSIKLGLKIPKLKVPIEVTDDCKSVKKSVENVKTVSEKYIFFEPVESSSPVIKKNNELLDKNLLSTNRNNDNAEDVNCPFKKQETEIDETKSEEAETSMPVDQNTDRLSSKLLNKIDKTLEECGYLSKSPKKILEAKKSIPVDQNTHSISSKMLNNKIDKTFNKSDILNNSQTSEIEKSSLKKSINSLKSYRSRSIDSPIEKEEKFASDSEGNKSLECSDLKESLSDTIIKLSEKERIDISEKEFESQNSNMKVEKITSRCGVKVADSSINEVSKDIKMDSLHSELKESNYISVDRVENKRKLTTLRRIENENSTTIIEQDAHEQNLSVKSSSIIDKEDIKNLTEDVNKIRDSHPTENKDKYSDEYKQEVSMKTDKKEKDDPLLANTTKTFIKSIGSKSLQNEISINDIDKLSKINVSSEFKKSKICSPPASSEFRKSKLGSPPASNRDIRLFFNHNSIDMSLKIDNDTKNLETASQQEKTDSNTNLLDSDKDDRGEKLPGIKQSKPKLKLENTQQTCVYSENSAHLIINTSKEKSSSFENEKIICSKENSLLVSTSCDMNTSSESLEMNCQNDNRLISPPARNRTNQKPNIKMPDIRQFFSPENTKKRRSLESEEICKRAKIKQELDYSQEDIEMKSCLKTVDLTLDALSVSEADFLGFNGSSSISLQRAGCLSEIVNTLTLKHSIPKEEFRLPIEQTCDLDEDLISNNIDTTNR